jgi:hypothetical protein
MASFSIITTSSLLTTNLSSVFYVLVVKAQPLQTASSKEYLVLFGEKQHFSHQTLFCECVVEFGFCEFECSGQLLASASGLFSHSPRFFVRFLA